MKFLKNTIGFLSVFCIVPAVFGATARPGVITAGSTVNAVAANGSVRRMPTLRLTTASNNTQSGGTSYNTMDSVECVDAYMECIESDDSCGSDFSECTTNVLFHAQMPDCTSVLMQCSDKGVSTLFGTSNIADLSNVPDDGYNKDKEIVRYTYPTDGSVMGQKIIAARIENMYDKSTCIKRYTNCLKRDDVCGENFELCSSTTLFRKQALACDTHLARCDMAAVREMFGDSTERKSISKYGIAKDSEGNPVEISVKDLTTVAGSIGIMIDEGSDYVAANAVSSCYRAVDSCVIKACKSNPLRCIEGTSVVAMQSAQGVVGEGGVVVDTASKGAVDEQYLKLTASEINRYLLVEATDF
ncbi:MAG: hypothetical protein II219_03590 [Alphaproteobacteria bacterium]|nr:hypothetical protein [Alphaproteobacteria bacterium]